MSTQAIDLLKPVGYWPLDEASGTTLVARHGANGSTNGSPTLREVGPGGDLPYGIGLNGGSDRCTLPQTTLGLAQPQSFAWWANCPTTVNTSNRYYFTEVNGSENTQLGPSTASLADEVFTVANNTGGSGDRTGWGNFTAAVGWHHWVLTFNGVQDGWRLFLDGRDVVTSMGGSFLSASGGAKGFSDSFVYLGQVGGSNSVFEVAGHGFWNRKLSLGEVAYLYEASRVGNVFESSYSPISY